jgi:hypothetical protein
MIFFEASHLATSPMPYLPCCLMSLLDKSRATVLVQLTIVTFLVPCFVCFYSHMALKDTEPLPWFAWLEKDQTRFIWQAMKYELLLLMHLHCSGRWGAQAPLCCSIYWFTLQWEMGSPGTLVLFYLLIYIAVGDGEPRCPCVVPSIVPLLVWSWTFRNCLVTLLACRK